MHNLNYNEESKKYAFASAKELPWHTKGQILDHVMNAEEAMCEAQLCFEVKKMPIYRDVTITDPSINDGTIRIIKEQITSHFETRRMDNNETLGIVGSGYKVVQNKDCFKFFDQIVGKKEAIFETAGALGNGSQVFITAKLPREIVVADVDLIQNYIALVTSHDMTLALTCFFTPIRIVCNNTLNVALRNNTNRVYLKHTINISNQMFEAARLMGLHSKYLNALQESFDFLASKTINTQGVEQMIKDVYLNEKQKKVIVSDEDVEISTRKKNTIMAVLNYYHSDPTLEKIRGTRYGAYNAITGYYQNVKEYSSDDLKMKNIVLQGTAWNYSQKAFDSLLKMN